MYALDLLRFCQSNPKPCPLGHDIDIRIEMPCDRMFRSGDLEGTGLGPACGEP